MYFNWISYRILTITLYAIPIEYIAARSFLGEEHEASTLMSPNDTSDYTLGKIRNHNVVIAVLPDSEYGTTSGASVAPNMLNGSPNIRIGLVVGISGGVPSEKQDVRLGDVVVSASRNGAGGVLWYDFGKAMQSQVFQHMRFLNQPSTTLFTAMTGIQAQYKRKGHQPEASIKSFLNKNARLRREYERPQPSTDKLFKAKVTHSSSCTADNPVIRYSLIASANQLIKDALVRDRLAAEKYVQFFEIGAACLM
ncbi:hypothetical protein N7523_001656 [Penicillium sp. IBT 18751x]|nr:hypothetical protein N7523_001656 [Penicillium sp. IBT 18751x]